MTHAHLLPTRALAGGVAVAALAVGLAVPVAPAGAAPVAEQPPTVDGSLRFGETLRVDPGAWDSPAPDFSYQWYRSRPGTGATLIRGGDARGYRVRAADAGRRLAVVVTATRPGEDEGTAFAVTTVVDRLDSAVRLRTSRARVPQGTRPRVTVALRSADTGVPSGTVVVRDGRRRVGTATTSRAGRVTLLLRRLAPGRHRLTATYAGTTRYAQSTSPRLVVTVRGR